MVKASLLNHLAFTLIVKISRPNHEAFTLIVKSSRPNHKAFTLIVKAYWLNRKAFILIVKIFRLNFNTFTIIVKAYQLNHKAFTFAYTGLHVRIEAVTPIRHKGLFMEEGRTAALPPSFRQKEEKGVVIQPPLLRYLCCEPCIFALQKPQPAIQGRA